MKLLLFLLISLLRNHVKLYFFGLYVAWLGGISTSNLCIMCCFKLIAKIFINMDGKQIGPRFLINPFNLPGFKIAVINLSLISFGCSPVLGIVIDSCNFICDIFFSSNGGQSF